jgi:hypothetical protein
MSPGQGNNISFLQRGLRQVSPLVRIISAAFFTRMDAFPPPLTETKFPPSSSVCCQFANIYVECVHQATVLIAYVLLTRMSVMFRSTRSAPASDGGYPGVGLPKRADVLQCDEAQGLEASRGRYEAHCGHTQHRERAGMV